MGKDKEIVLWFKDLTKEDIPMVGGKCANLGELYGKIDVPVPNGFAVTAYAYQLFLHKTSAVKKIEAMLSNIDIDDIKTLQETSEKIRQFIEGLQMPKEIANKILESYDTLCSNRKKKDIPVAVRSSATAEDLPGASFAGQQDTFLNIHRDSLLKKVQECWSSLFTPRAIAYRKEKGFEHEKVLISVGVQELIESYVSGVMFTMDPVSGDKNKIVINGSWGLGEAVVSGSITPDEFVFDKNIKKIVDRQVFKKERQIVSDKKGSTKWVEVPKNMQDKPALTDAQIMQLAEFGLKIEKHYNFPQDIEWALDSNGNFYILQARPVTVGVTDTETKDKQKAEFSEQDVIVRGLGVSPGIGSGKAKIILNVKDIVRLEKGEILVTEMTTPDWVPAMKKSSAIVTNLGGKTCHAAIVSRELGVPCIVGAKNATGVIPDGQVVTVDGKRGIVFKGEITSEKVDKPVSSTADISSQIVTATKVFVNL
ncbi:MAG: phosphoenolpyruvate synthase, partial [Thermodesulfovibrionales bacterium]